jgi:hypothetical protein
MIPNVTNEKVLNVIKSEQRNAGRFSSDVMKDAEITKNVLDRLCKNKDSIITGYIQEIRLNKFGILMFSEKQVTINSNNLIDVFNKVF